MPHPLVFVTLNLSRTRAAFDLLRQAHRPCFSADLGQQMPLIAGIKELSVDVQPSLATAQP